MPTCLIVRLVFWLWLLAALYVENSLLRQHLPLSLRPTFLVPLIIATPVIIFLRLREAPTT